MATTLNEVTLFVKAGFDGIRYGSCPFSHRIFMVLLLKSFRNRFNLKIMTVNLTKPPHEFKDLELKRVPALLYGDDTFDNVDDIISFIDERFPLADLTYDDPEAESACEHLFSKFCYYLKGVLNDFTPLNLELKKFSDYLFNNQTAYLCGNELSHLDCEILPKLQHIRVALKGLKGIDIPSEYYGFWNYLRNAYSNPIFQNTCPCDQEIMIHWADKPETPKLSMESRSYLANEDPSFSMSVPILGTMVKV